MAMWRGIGGFNTLAKGATATWEIVYGNGRDVGPVVVRPNIIEEVSNIELVSFDQGVVGRGVGGEAGPAIHYTARIRNNGAFAISYNLNVGDWQ